MATLLSAITQAHEFPQDKELTQEARRLAHNLKGTSRSCGFDMVGEASGELEKILTKMQEPDADRTEPVWLEVTRIFESVRTHAEMEIKHAPTQDQIDALVDDSAMAKVLVVGNK